MGCVTTEDGKYEALCGRDPWFDGESFFTVAMTGIYCRPSCPATTSKRKNVRFFPTAAAAHPGTDCEQAEREPLALRGIGVWTAGHIRLRALSDPDVLLSGDVAIGAEMRDAGASFADAEAWRTWRSYAMHHFWPAATATSPTA